MARGLFITFEGMDGSGKSTQIAFFRDFLAARGIPSIFTREPGGTPIGERIREILLDPAWAEMSAVTEGCLYAASRAQHIREVVRPALEQGTWVISDRFYDSSLAYQGFGRGLGDTVAEVNRAAVDGILPDRTYFLDVPPSIGLLRAEARGEAGGKAEGERKDRIEREPDAFQQKVYDGFCHIAEAEPARVLRVDGTLDAETIGAIIRQDAEQLLGRRDAGVRD